LIEDEKTLYAIVRCFEIIGEAAKNIQKKSGKSMTKFHGRIWQE
jgi:uncharacterized protein with HEPN domain